MIRNLFLLAPVLLAASGLVWAESSADVIKVHLATPVMVGDVQFPAGEATVSVMDTNSGNIALLVRSESGVQNVVLANPVEYSGISHGRTAGLVLGNENGVYYLDQAWFPLKGVGYKVIRR